MAFQRKRDRSAQEAWCVYASRCLKIAVSFTIHDALLLALVRPRSRVARTMPTMQQIGGELYPFWKSARQDSASAFARVVLPVPGTFLQQHMSAARKRSQQVADGCLLAFYDLAQVGGQALQCASGSLKVFVQCAPSPHLVQLLRGFSLCRWFNAWLGCWLRKCQHHKPNTKCKDTRKTQPDPKRHAQTEECPNHLSAIARSGQKQPDDIG